MIALDTNLLVYAYVAQSPWYRRARELVGALASSGAPWAIPVQCLHEFYGIVTNPRIYKPASSIDAACAQIEAWLSSPSVSVLAEDATTSRVLRELVRSAKVIGPAVHDTRIAATCIAHGVTELWTSDRNFSRYPALRVRNPLVEQPSGASEPRARYRTRARVSRDLRP